VEWLVYLWPFRPNRAATIVLGCVGVSFFGSLLAFCLRRHDHRDYVPAWLLLTIGSSSVLFRGLFGYRLSPHPASPGGLWRLLTAVVMLAGGFFLERARRRELARRA
jgi:hypothetical protein